MWSRDGAIGVPDGTPSGRAVVLDPCRWHHAARGDGAGVLVDPDAILAAVRGEDVLAGVTYDPMLDEMFAAEAGQGAGLLRPEDDGSATVG